jgi:glycosyltransferase involved in cell wall biosynthesis
MANKSKGLSIIIPVHNGARHLGRSVGMISGHLRKNGLVPHQIVIAEDGSSDGSGEIAKRLAERSKNILAISRKGRLGKGRAITNAVAHCKYEKVIFTDVDLSAGIEGVGEISKRLDSADLVIGSRYLPGSTCARSFSRTLLSMGYRLCVALLFLKSHSDYQCGFKGFRKSSMHGIIRSIQADSWFWDTELILEADALGKKIDEVPVRWHEEKSTSLKVGPTIIDLLLSLLRYRIFGASRQTGGRR